MNHYDPNAVTVGHWDARFLELARLVATWSKDRSTKVGAVIVGPDREVRGTGYNGFPRGVNDGIPELQERPAKYLWTEHAERNAIYGAARFGAPLLGCTIYVTHPPCSACARGIVQSGLKRAVFENLQPDMEERWRTEIEAGFRILCQSGVEILRPRASSATR